MAENTKTDNKPETIPFYPDHIRTEAWVSFGVLGLLILVGVLGTLFPLGLEAPADPLITPAHTKPEWYFLFLYQVLKFVPKTVGAILPFIGIFVLMFWPFIDRWQDSVRMRRIRIAIAAVALLAIAALTIWGEVS
jgi:quinol-cytochrome oxidoreductase complex cytochrome b subunit